MQEDAINLEQDASDVKVDDSAINRVSGLAEKQLKLESDLAKLEEYRESLQKEFREVSEKSLPDAMIAAGISEFKLVNGAKITMKKFYSGRIMPEDAPVCYNWLRENDFADLIKHEIVIPLGRGNDEDASEITDYLKENNVQYTDKEGVHHSTLNAFIKEQMEMGCSLPPQFNVYMGNKTKIVIKR